MSTIHRLHSCNVQREALSLEGSRSAPKRARAHSFVNLMGLSSVGTLVGLDDEVAEVGAVDSDVRPIEALAYM